jgi:hypothetical protein
MTFAQFLALVIKEYQAHAMVVMAVLAGLAQILAGQYAPGLAAIFQALLTLFAGGVAMHVVHKIKQY